MGSLETSARGENGTASMLGAAIIGAVLAVGVIASLRTGKTIAFDNWRMPYVVSRRKEPGDFWFMVILLGVTAGVFATIVAIHDITALLWPTLTTVAVAGGV